MHHFTKKTGHKTLVVPYECTESRRMELGLTVASSSSENHHVAKLLLVQCASVRLVFVDGWTTLAAVMFSRSDGPWGNILASDSASVSWYLISASRHF